jgi:ribosomal protein S18 acetylase RimI-like enzyme
MKIRRSRIEDQAHVSSLYRRVAAVPGGIARLSGEISRSYVAEFLRNASDRGLGLVVENEAGRFIAEIHAYTPAPSCFSHVLSELTIVVDPDQQGRGIGRILFERFQDIVSKDFPHIRRIELIARESNRAAINFYESLGFQREGKLAGRILNVDGSVECDIPMAWAVNSRLDWAYSRTGTISTALSTGFIKLGALTRKTGVIASHVAAVLVIFAVLDDTPQDAHANDLQVETPIELISRE